MFVKDGKSYLKIYERRDQSKFFLRDGKRVDVSSSRKIYRKKPTSSCQNGREQLNSTCSKKCKYPRIRNKKTSRCKKM